MTHLKSVAILLFAACLTSCGGGGDAAIDRSDMVARVGKSVLTMPELMEKVPYGLTPDDSVRFVSAYVRQWVDARIMGEVAARNIPDMPSVEEKVNAYRNELIMMEYRRLMYEQNKPAELSEDSLKAYYGQHRDDFRLEVPIIKGIFVKMPDNAVRLNDIRKWIKSGSEDDLDKIEKYQLTDPKAMEYDYFADSWTDWGKIAGRMPLDFNASPEMLARMNKDFEMTRNGYTYILKVTDVLSKDAVAPFETVKENIRDFIAGTMRVEYDRRLRQHLYEEGLKSGDVEINIDIAQSEKAKNGE